jgi:alkylation response protein AidB-like acyl-CoA dehydrogenase
VSTLARERAAAMMFALRTRALVWKAARRHAPNIPAYRRDDMLRLYVEAEALGLLAERSIAEIGGGNPGPAQSVVKLAWSQVDQKHAELLFDPQRPAGAGGLAPDATDALLFSRSSTITAGTTEVMRNILAEQVLGLPR